MPGGRKRKTVIDLTNANEDEEKIRYGALEILAVYVGGDDDDNDENKTNNDQDEDDNKKSSNGEGNDESKKKKDFEFVRITADVLVDDKDDEEEIGVEWMDEEEKNGTLYLWDLEKQDPDEIHSVAIGALICAVTHEVVDKADGSIEVPDSVVDRVQKKLALQLSDDYDPAQEDADELTYQARSALQRKRLKRLKRQAGVATKRDYESSDDEGTSTKKKKRGPRKSAASKVKMEDGASGDEEDFGASPSRRKSRGSGGTRRSTSGGGTRSPKKKGAGGSAAKARKRLDPRPEVKVEEDIFTKSSGTKYGTFSGDTFRASKEVIRAVRTGSIPLLKKLIKDKKNIADLYIKQSAFVPIDAMTYALIHENREALELLSKERDDTGNRAPFPERSLAEKTSGRHTSRYADYNRYDVAASRGGKEGNNAFVKDDAHKAHSPALYAGGRRELGHLFMKNDACSLDFLKFLEKKVYDNDMYDWNFPLDVLLVSGHRELTEIAMKLMLPRGMGLNQMHVDVLGTDPSAMEKPRSISVVKKSTALGVYSTRFCPVHCAATNPNPEYLKRLLEAAPDALDCEDTHEARPLHYAAVSEGPDTLKWLLETHTSLQRDVMTRKPRMTPLMWAARAARPANVRVLCQGVPEDDVKRFVSVLSARGLSAMHMAVSNNRSGRFDTVRALLECGADVDVRGDTRLMDKVTPSMIAARNGDLQMLELLVERGASLAITDKLGRTLLIWASMNGHLHIVTYLLREGVDVNAADSSDNTALHYASAYGWVECVEALLVYAEPDPRNNWSSSPLSIALKRGAFPCAAVLLKLKDKVDVNVVDKNGRSLFSSLIGTYLWQLASNSDTPIPWAIKQMLDREDLDVSAVESTKRTVLHYIAESNSASLPVIQELVGKLLDRGLDPLVMDKAGDVAASLALRDGDLNFARTLLERASHASIPLIGVEEAKRKGKNISDADTGCTLLQLLVRRMSKKEDIEVFSKVYEALKGNWEARVDQTGRTPLLVAAGILADTATQDGEVWSWRKEVFLKLLDWMPAVHIRDVAKRRPEFREWKHVEQRLEDQDEKEPDWVPSDEFDVQGNDFCSIFHALCSLKDVEWAVEVFRKLVEKVQDKSSLKALLNLKQGGSKLPLLRLMDNFALFAHNEKKRGSAIELLQLLAQYGADLGGVYHHLFKSMADAKDSDVEMGALFDSSDENDDLKLQRVREYVVQRERKRVKKQLAKKCPPSALKQQFRPFLHRTLDYGMPVELLRAYLELPNVDVDARDFDDDAGLHVVARKGDHAKTDVLVSRADVNLVNKQKESALIIAASRGDLQLVEKLLGAEADLSINAPKVGTALHAAVRSRNAKVVEAVLRKASADDVNVRDADKRTPLHYAIAICAVSTKQELKPIEKQLLDAGADVNAKDKHGRTPLSYAFVALETDMKCSFPAQSKRDPVETVSMLCGRDDIQLDFTDEEERTPLHLAAGMGATICALSLIESNPKQMEAVDMDKNTPLALALCANRWDTALLLISKGCSIDVDVTQVQRVWEKKKLVEKSRSVNPGLWHAVREKSLSTFMLSANRIPLDTVLRTLLRTGSLQKALQQIQQCRDKKLVREPSKDDGMTTLHRLAQVQTFAHARDFDIAIADELLKAGASVKDTCKRGYTVIHVAAFHGHVNLAKNLLVERGADADAKDLSGKSPVASAFAGHSPSAEMLCVLLDASRKAAALANSVVGARRGRKDDEALRRLASPESRMFDTEPSKCRSKEVFIGRLRKIEEAKARKRASNDDESDAESDGSADGTDNEDTMETQEQEPDQNDSDDGNNSDDEEQELFGDDSEDEEEGDDDNDGSDGDEEFLLDEDNSQDDEQKDLYDLSSTALIEAVRASDMRMVNVLLSYGADQKKQDEEGRTALHHAAILNNNRILSLLLRFSTKPIDMEDKHGFTALTYALLVGIRQRESSTSLGVEILLDYGANPQAGEALKIAVRNNQLGAAKTLLHCTNTTLQAATKRLKKSKKYEPGDNVWVRFGGVCGSWMLSTVLRMDGRELSVIPGRSAALDSDRDRLLRFHAVQKVHQNWVCAVDEEEDVPASANSILAKHFKQDDQTSEQERVTMLEERAGAEHTLMEKMEVAHPSVLSTLAEELKVGDTVGKFIDQASIMKVGTVVSAHANGLFDFQPLKGPKQEKLKRTDLRTLRAELCLKGAKPKVKFDAGLVHEAVRPVEFGSFENVDMLHVLVEAGVPVDGENDKGQTALDLARPGSDIQDLLRKELKEPEGGREISAKALEGPPSLDGIDLEKDSDASLQKLHEEGADTTERIVPDVSDVCELESEGIYVAKDGADDYFDVSLTKVDVDHGRHGKYVFYKMQIVHDPVQKLYVLLTNWGRIGEEGKHQETPFSSKEECAKEFCKVFKGKSGNLWEERSSFERKPKKYALVDTKRTRVKNPEKLLGDIVENSSLPCGLDSSVGAMLRSLLNVKMLVNAVASTGLDQSQLPLGQLSLETLDKAEAKLREIKDLWDAFPSDADADAFRASFEKVAKLTSEYYELIPIGDQDVKPFEQNSREYGEAVNLIRELRDLNVTKQLLLGAMHRQETLNPIDYVYKALQVRMEPLAPTSKERRCLERYIDSTCTDNVLVNQVFALDNGQDLDGSIGNKRLLFHGSKNMNILGILKQGLRIAPPEAPTTGYMYGKGVYFADQFSKSFGYATRPGSHSSDDEQPRAFVFVAEVMMGKPHVAYQAEYMEAPKDGTHSTFAPGNEAPDDALSVVVDRTGAVVPLGKLTPLEQDESQKYKWTTGSYWNDLAPEESDKIETKRNDPLTVFPTTVRVKYRDSEYEVRLDKGPLCNTVTAMPVEEEEKEKTDGDEEKEKVKEEGADIDANENNDKNGAKDEDMEEVDEQKEEKEDEEMKDSNEKEGEEDDAKEDEAEDAEDDKNNKMEDDGDKDGGGGEEGDSDDDDLGLVGSDDDDDDDIDMGAFRGRSNRYEVTFRRQPKSNNHYKSQSEFIVYDTKQIRLKYLIELTTPAWVKQQFERELEAKKKGTAV